VDRELRLEGVSRSFGTHVALDDVSFTVRPGRTTGFVGANGAGKTTAMRIVLGVLAADRGQVTLGGAPLTPALRARFGYMPEERGLYPKMKVADQLVYLGRVHGLDTATARRRTAALLDELGLADRADDVLQTLSLGNQQRVQVAAALVHDPIMLVLDEPFSGLDPLAIDAMGAQLRERAAAGVPVLFSSHQLELVERLCDDLVIIDHGRVVAAGEAGELQGEAAEAVAELAAELGARETPDAQLPVALIGVGGLPAAEITTVTVEPGVDVARLLQDEDVAAALLGEDLDDLHLVGLRDVPGELETLVRAASSELQVAQAAADAGLSAQEVAALTQPEPPALELLEPRPEGTVPPQLLVLLFAFLFYLSVLTFGTSIAQSVVEEKQSRVVELLVAAMPVRWLLAGKVLGNTVMAVGQVVVIVGAGLIGGMVAGQGELVRQLAASSGWFVLFFLLGFVMLSCLWAVGGSLASRVEDLSSTTALMQILVIVPFFAAVLPIDEGTQRVLSYVPFTAPLLMPARIVHGAVEPWEPVVAAVLVLVTAAVLVVLGARLYAGSVLHTSGRMKAAQAWRGLG